MPSISGHFMVTPLVISNSNFSEEFYRAALCKKHLVDSGNDTYSHSIC